MWTKSKIDKKIKSEETRLNNLTEKYFAQLNDLRNGNLPLTAHNTNTLKSYIADIRESETILNTLEMILEK